MVYPRFTVRMALFILRKRYRVPSSFLEIIELDNGEVVLRRPDDDGEPLVSIHFSDESCQYMMGNSLEVAKVMIQAGIQAAAEIAEQVDVEFAKDGTAHVVH